MVDQCSSKMNHIKQFRHFAIASWAPSHVNVDAASSSKSVDAKPTVFSEVTMYVITIDTLTTNLWRLPTHAFNEDQSLWKSNWNKPTLPKRDRNNNKTHRRPILSTLLTQIKWRFDSRSPFLEAIRHNSEDDRSPSSRQRERVFHVSCSQRSGEEQ